MNRFILTVVFHFVLMMTVTACRTIDTNSRIIDTNNRTINTNIDNTRVPIQWSVDFLSRPASGPIYINGESNIKISNKSFSDIKGVAIIIANCHDVEITECDFSNVVGGIYILNSTNVTVTWNRFSNIGDGTIGDGHSNYVQFNHSFGGYIAYNKGKGGNTEDMISIYKSGGSSEDAPLIIEYNHFEGRNWVSRSGSGIMLGDNGGQYTVARYNKLLSPGQVGIGIASGIYISVIGNTVYGEKMPKSNVGMYVWNQYNTPLESSEITENRVRWYNQDGEEGPYWNGERAKGRDFTPKGEENNDWYADLDPKELEVTL